MTVAFLCPGQGAQSPGFLHRLPDHPAVAATIAETSEALDEDVLGFDREDALRSTVAVQLSTVIAGVAAARVLAANGVGPAAVAGMSVGAFTAAVVCRALSLPDAVRLVRLRARLMEQAFPQGYGMAAVVGLDERRLRALIGQVHSMATPVFLANLNAPTQYVAAGSAEGLDRLVALAQAAGARKAERLAVAVPSHCPLLAGPAHALAQAIAEIGIAVPGPPYVTNRGARVTRDPQRIADDLACSLMHPVRWHECTEILYEGGTRLFIELPPGSVLADLAAQALPDARAVTADGTPAAALAALASQIGNTAYKYGIR